MDQRTNKRDAWRRAVAASTALSDAARELQTDYPTTYETLRRELHGTEQTTVLFLLRYLDVDYTVALLDDLVAMSISARHAVRVRENLGRLPHTDAAHLVPAAVWRQIAKTNDDETYLMLAKLLEDLGLTDALHELLRRARASDDPNIREVADDYPPESFH